MAKRPKPDWHTRRAECNGLVHLVEMRAGKPDTFESWMWCEVRNMTWYDPAFRAETVTCLRCAIATRPKP